MIPNQDKGQNDGRRYGQTYCQTYCMMIEFEQPEPLIQAAKTAYAAGFRKMDAFTPYPIEGLADAIGFRKNYVPLISLLGGLGGGTLAFVMQWYCNVIDYPINVGGRPYFSWPAFIPVTFELTVLGAALSAAFGMLALNGLPKPWHPAFNLPEFARASRDRFFLCIHAKDPNFNPKEIRTLFKNLKGENREVNVHEVMYDL